MEIDEILAKLKLSDTDKIKFAVADIDGVLRGKYIHKNKFLDSLEKGIGFCDVIFGWDSSDSCYDNTNLTGWHTGYPDSFASIDLTTFREIPWEGSVPFFIADFSGCKNNHITACPRTLLKTIRARAGAMGFRAQFALETEWFNFAGKPSELTESGFSQLKPITPGMFGYSILRTSLNSQYFNDLFDLLSRFKIPLEGLHTETGPGVTEGAIIADEILAAADKAILFKNGVKEIAYKHNIIATFMAKWNSALPGCGGHIHQSLWNPDGSENLFFGPDDKNGMSKRMEQYIAGILVCLPEILPMFAPTINSYKRLGHGDWAPSTITWGIDNRTTSVRVINGDRRSTRIEFRVPGADINPYLAMAASLAAGLYGIENSLELKIPETIGNGYKDFKNGVLPANLAEATEKMAGSKIANQLFGEDFVSHFVKTREWEWKQYSKAVTDWELKRYFEII
jgi:glutamine synthetase